MFCYRGEVVFSNLSKDLSSISISHFFSSVMTSALIGAVDQGTGSSRFLIFSEATGELITYHQEEVRTQHPKEGWAEVDPKLLLSTVYSCIERAVKNLEALGSDPKKICAIGLTNQRETLVVWDRNTGQPLSNAIIWLDVRNAETANQLISKTKTKKQNYFQVREIYFALYLFCSNSWSLRNVFSSATCTCRKAWTMKDETSVTPQTVQF